MNDTCPLDSSCEHLLHLDSPSLSSELQDNSSFVESSEPESVPDSEDLLQLESTSVSSQDTSCIEMEFLPEFEGQLDHANLSPTDVFLEHHDYELFLLQKEVDTPYDNLNHHDTHVCDNQDEILIHATNLSHTVALPQYIAQNNCEDLEPTDNPSAVPTSFQASSNHTFNTKCAHNLMATQSNQSHYSNLLKQTCAHNPSASQDSQANLLTSPYPPNPAGHVKVLLPEECIPTSIPTICNLKSTLFPFGVDSLSSTIEMRPDLPSLASPKGDMESPFRWTNFVKSPTPST